MYLILICVDPEAFIKSLTLLPLSAGLIWKILKAPMFSHRANAASKIKNPIFHDDQHGTAIVVAAGLLNALELQNKNLSQVKIVCAGAGAAGIATMQLLIKLGANRDNLYMVDNSGVIHSERNDLNS